MSLLSETISVPQPLAFHAPLRFCKYSSLSECQVIYFSICTTHKHLPPRALQVEEHPTKPAAITKLYGIQCFVQTGAFRQTNMERRASRSDFSIQMCYISNEEWFNSKHISLEMRWCLSSCEKLTFSSLGGQHRGTRGDGELEPPERNQERFFFAERKSTPISLCSISHESVMICLVDMGF